MRQRPAIGNKNRESMRWGKVVVVHHAQPVPCNSSSFEIPEGIRRSRTALRRDLPELLARLAHSMISGGTGMRSIPFDVATPLTMLPHFGQEHGKDSNSNPHSGHLECDMDHPRFKIAYH